MEMLRETGTESFQSGFIQLYRNEESSIRGEISEGLLSPQAYISPKFLYNELGSKLFEAICQLPEYYLTRVEAAVMEENRIGIAQSVGQGGTLIDLGAGNCAKAATFFSSLKPSHYVPIDISVDFLKDSVSRLQRQFPKIMMTGLGMDFSSDISLPQFIQEKGRLFFYPGSSIGNFSSLEALALLKKIRKACLDDGSLLIGVDLIKDKTIFDLAYDDALGVTAAFNRNLLMHLNDLLGTDFQIQNWQHRGFFNSTLNRVEMHLEAKKPCVVSWGNVQRQFFAGERIHTESSYKYTKQDFVRLLQQAGFGEVRTWTDPKSWFLICHAKAQYEH